MIEFSKKDISKTCFIPPFSAKLRTEVFLYVQRFSQILFNFTRLNVKKIMFHTAKILAH